MFGEKADDTVEIKCNVSIQ